MKSTLAANEFASIIPPPENVVTNGFDEYAVNPPTITVMG